MSATDYLLESGSGMYRPWHVPDLVPPNGAAELVFVFESPHVDELRSGLPVVGAAGMSALRFLLPDQPKDRSLGRFVQQSHLAGDGRIATLNVSNVPMQADAFVDGDAPDLRDSEWALIGKVRRSRARSVSSMRGTESRAVTELLVGALRDRLYGLAFGGGRQIVAAGIFAQRMMAAVSPDLSPDPLRVPHPSFNQWNRTRNQNLPDLVEARNRFRDCIDGSTVQG